MDRKGIQTERAYRQNAEGKDMQTGRRKGLAGGRKDGRRQMDGRKDGRTDGWTDRQTDRGTGRQISPAFYRTSLLWGHCPAHNL